MEPRRSLRPSGPSATARACRGEAADNLLFAQGLPLGRERTLFERTAAAWLALASKRVREDGART